MSRIALLALLPISAVALTGCGHHGSGERTPASSTAPGAGSSLTGTSTPTSTSPAPGRSASAGRSAPPAGSASAGGTAAPGGGTAAASGGSGATATTGAPAAGSAASALGLDRPVGGFRSAAGISGVMTSGGLVSGFSDTLARPESLSAATAGVSAYLPAGTSYGASTTAGPCRTVQLLGSKHPTDVAFCSDTTSGAGSSTYTAASIAEITVSADDGLS